MRRQYRYRSRASERLRGRALNRLIPGPTARGGGSRDLPPSHPVANPTTPKGMFYPSQTYFGNCVAASSAAPSPEWSPCSPFKFRDPEDPDGQGSWVSEYMAFTANLGGGGACSLSTSAPAGGLPGSREGANGLKRLSYSPQEKRSALRTDFSPGRERWLAIQDFFLFAFDIPASMAYLTKDALSQSRGSTFLSEQKRIVNPADKDTAF